MNKKILADRRILILRAREQSGELMEKLQLLGAEVHSMPLIDFEPCVNELQKISQAYLKSFTAVCFTSSNGVRFFIEGLHKKGLSIKALNHMKICAVGPKTAGKLLEYGIDADLVPEKYCAEGILEALPSNLKKEKFLLAIAADAKTTLQNGLIARGAALSVLKAYKTVPVNSNLTQVLEGDWIVFTSPSTVAQFFNCLKSVPALTAFCIGNTTKEELEKVFNGPIFVSEKATAGSIIQCMVDYRDRGS